MKTKKWIAIIINAFILIVTIVCLIQTLFGGLSGNMEGFNSGMLCFFTIDSNIYLAVSSLIALPFLLQDVLKGKDSIGKPVQIMRYSATVAVTVTLLVAMCFLSILFGFGAMLQGENLFYHLLSPLLSIISLLLFENNKKLDKIAIFYGVLPVLIYAVVYFIEVVIVGNWYDFYGFNRNNSWPITIVVMTVFVALLNIVMMKIYNRKHK